MSAWQAVRGERPGIVIGTAGHVDHGKSELVRALTDIHPDRLQEEQQRGLSIDLGFAWLDLEESIRVGIVDVPGHIDFIENMLAGVGGIDAALLVVAVDEGVMPQTREHLAILDLLDTRFGIVVLSKVDLSPGPEWARMVREDVEELVSGTSAEAWPILPVSSVTLEGIEKLRLEIGAMAHQVPESSSPAATRLPIDRVFSVAGFGTVATGTLLGGELRRDDQVEIFPQGVPARIRGLESHHRSLRIAFQGSRVAVNLSGVTTDQIERGDLLALPGSFLATARIDVHFRMLRSSPKALKHNEVLKIYVGPAQRMVRVRLLQGGEVRPGAMGILQLLLDAPICTHMGERFILRRPSPGETIGGGLVLDPHALGRHKLSDPSALARLTRLKAPAPADRMAAWLAGRPPLLASEIARLTGWDLARVVKLLQELERRGRVAALPAKEGDQARYLISEAVDSQLEALKSALDEYHARNPLARGIPKAELAEQMGLALQVLDGLIGLGAESANLAQEGPFVKLGSHEAELSASQEQLMEDLSDRFKRDPFSPPTVEQAREQVGEALYGYMKESGDLVEVSPEIVFHREAYDQAVERVRALIREQGTVSVASLRDELGSSRKYILPLLEFLDRQRVTVRDGDLRRLSKGADPA